MGSFQEGVAKCIYNGNKNLVSRFKELSKQQDLIIRFGDAFILQKIQQRRLICYDSTYQGMVPWGTTPRKQEKTAGKKKTVMKRKRLPLPPSPTTPTPLE